MSDILTYLAWRGDITLCERTFNEVDNLVMSLFCYIDFTPVLADPAAAPTIREAYEDLHRSGSEVKTKAFDRPGYFERLWKMLAGSARFGGALIKNYVEIHDDERQTQFAALHIELEDDTTYVAFRGTDQTICGWRESFAMSFEIVPAQIEAVEYVNRTFRKGIRYRMGGHSKGGNLALYSAIMCRDELKPQILQVFTNDGPGLSPEILNSGKYDAVQSKVIRIIPEFSIIGMLFEQYEPGCQYIVTSSESGPFQHAGDTWQVGCDGFVLAEDISPKCMELNRIIDEWLEQVEPEKRRVFIRDLFDALEASGTKNLDEVGKQGAEGFEAVLESLGKVQKDTKTTFKKLLKTFWRHLRPADLLDLFTKRTLVRGIFLLLMGVGILKLPQATVQVVVSICILLLVLVAAKRILGILKEKNQWMHPGKISIIAYYVLLGVLSLFTLQGGALLLGATFPTAVLCLLYGYWNLQKCIRSENRHELLFTLTVLRVVISSLLGLSTLVAGGRWLEILNQIVGNFMLVDGAIEVICAAVQKIRMRPPKNRIVQEVYSHDR